MPNSENVTTKFRVDISDLKKNIAEANRQLKTAQAEFKNATAGMQKGEQTVDSLSAQIKAQEKVVESEKAKLAALKEELSRYNANVEKGEQTIADLTQKHEAAARQYGENSEQAKKYAKQLDEAQKAQERNKTAAENLNTQIINQDTHMKNAQGSVDRLKNELNNLQTEESETTSETDKLNGELENVGSQAQKTTDGGLGAFSIALGSLAADVITKVIDGLGKMADKAKESFEQFDKGRDAVIKATGATGEQADEITKSYGEVAKRVPGGLEKIGETVGEVNTRFGLTGEELEKCSEDFLKFADITGVDAKTAVQDVSKAMAGAGIEIKGYSDLLDELAAASQTSGVSTDKLTENLTKYGAQMRTLGFDTDETIALFAQWEKAGVNTETALSGMRKAVGAWSANGKNAREMFAKTVNEIASSSDKTKAAQKAVEEFGSKAGPELADAIRSGRFFSDIGTKVGQAIGGAFKSAINAVLSTVENALNFVPNAINGALDLINKLPNVDIPFMPTVALPRLMAKGGIATRATNAIIGEGGDDEAVIPLKTGIPKIAAALANELSVQSAAPSVTNTYNFYQTNNSPKALSRWDIYRQTRNQLNFARGF